MVAGQQPVDGGAQLRLIADAVPFYLMLDVAFALILAEDDDRQAVPLFSLCPYYNSNGAFWPDSENKYRLRGIHSCFC